jgi:probable F420-dependent oxidoreductase
MRIGYVTPNSWGLDTPQTVVELARHAEGCGADSIWCSHHVLHRGFIGDRLRGKPYHDPLVMLTAFATATERCRLGTSVLVTPYLHPMPTAKTLATIDHLSRGRLDVGVGVGGLRVEHDDIGQVPYEQRGRYGDEFLEVMTLLWSEKAASFTGRFFSFRNLVAHPGPFRTGGLPLLVGGRGSAAMDRAARFGNGWHGIGRRPEEATLDLEALRRAFEAEKRSFDGLPFQMRLHVEIDDLDVDRWRSRFERYAAAGVTELVLAPQSGDADLHRRWLDAVVPSMTD